MVNEAHGTTHIINMSESAQNAFWKSLDFSSDRDGVKMLGFTGDGISERASVSQWHAGIQFTKMQFKHKSAAHPLYKGNSTYSSQRKGAVPWCALRWTGSLGEDESASIGLSEDWVWRGWTQDSVVNIRAFGLIIGGWWWPLWIWERSGWGLGIRF